MPRGRTALLVALPGLLLAAVGYLVHPGFLDVSTARAWWQVHVWLVPVFPLISLAVVLLLRGTGGPLAWAARIAAYGFATLYTALDVLSGIGAGLAVEAGAGALVGRLFEIGDAIGLVGVWMLLAAAVLTGLALLPRDGPRVLAGAAVLAAACFPFMTGHIFHPVGVLAMLLLALGCALTALARRDVREVIGTGRTARPS